MTKKRPSNGPLLFCLKNSLEVVRVEQLQWECRGDWRLLQPGIGSPSLPGIERHESNLLGRRRISYREVVRRIMRIDKHGICNHGVGVFSQSPPPVPVKSVNQLVRILRLGSN